MKPYITRHTSATLLLHAGVSLKAVSRRLGHKNGEVTLKHYMHTRAEDEELAVVVLGKVFGDWPRVVPQEAERGRLPR